MQRCIFLASLAKGNVAPNPVVGAVLVHHDKIIGEGYHQQYGKAHAEVNCIASVKAEDLYLVSKSVLYVSLEPCSHWGKTPPCADLIIEKKIPHVVVGCRDPFAAVNGKGIEKLEKAGIQVTVGILEEECKKLNKRFFTFHQKKRPYVILKWAQTADKKMAAPSIPQGESGDSQPPLRQETYDSTTSLKSEGRALESPSLEGFGEAGRVPLLISNSFSNRLVHKWRSEEAGIVVATNTALYDNPRLNTRLWPGKNPIRIVIDMNLRLPPSLHLFDGSVPTIIFNKKQHTLNVEKIKWPLFAGTHYYKLIEDADLIQQLLTGLYELNIQSILVEGGAQLLQSFIDAGLWDEARVITNEELIVGDGLPAPQLYQSRLTSTQKIFSDLIQFYHHQPKP